MAILNEDGFEGIKGKFGNVVAKKFNGKTIISARPSQYTVSNKPEAVEARDRFRVTVDLARAVNSLSALKSIWKTAKGKCSTGFNKICQINFQYSSAVKPTINNIITPGGFILPVISAACDEAKLTASISALNTNTVFCSDEVILSVNAVVCFINPVNSEDKAYGLIACFREIDNFNFTQDFDIQIDFDPRQKIEADKYSGSIIFLSAATKTAGGKIVKFSNTAAIA